jgi:hypothetical protein
VVNLIKKFMRYALVLVMFFLILGISLNAQHFASLNDVKFDYDGAYEDYTDQVYDCCYYLLQNPYSKKDSDRKAASDFIARWIKGAPDYPFKIEEEIKVLTEERADLLELYTACYVKEVLENAEEGMKLNAINDTILNSFLVYCSKPVNKVKLTKEMKKIILEEEIAMVE